MKISGSAITIPGDPPYFFSFIYMSPIVRETFNPPGIILT